MLASKVRLTKKRDIAGLPSLSFSSFTSPPSNNRYFQYRAILETDASTPSDGPELKSVTVGPVHYDAGTPSIYTVNGIDYVTLNGFSVSSACAGVARYQLKVGSGAWKYHDGSGWVDALDSYDEANIASDIHDHISELSLNAGTGPTTLKVRAYLKSNGVQSCSIDSISVTGTR